MAPTGRSLRSRSMAEKAMLPGFSNSSIQSVQHSIGATHLFRSYSASIQSVPPTFSDPIRLAFNRCHPPFPILFG